MSGGFFRGTSAAQDTRFSNKQAKLMKSQKFPPELEHLVDIRKVKMDVMKPWIATRVTEFLGFEDEVLINFIYGLLDGKEVNGKEVQIQLTGFMEKNTGKFMKELWTLLLSAQQNSSGVPQQFLDAKEEETRKKKAETDRIADEIQRKKELEKKDLEPEKRRNLEDEADILEKDDPRSKHQTQESSAHFADEEFSKRNGSRGRSRSTRSRSVSKSVSNSRSYSGEKKRPRSTSKSPQSRGRSISSDKMRHSRLKRSVTPPRRLSSRRSRSPPVRISSNSRQRSSSRSRRRSRSPPYRRLRTPPRRRSRSPVRSRSPIRRRSRTPTRYRSRSPIRRRSPSPVHSRSASPVRRRSPPVRRRSPSPYRRRSPSSYKRRLPSPYRRKSPSPVQHRSISPPWRRSRSPVRRRSPLPPLRRRYHRSPSKSRSRSPIHYKSSVLGRRGSPSPPRRKSSSVEGSSSQSPVRHMSKSPIRRKSPRYHRSPVQERDKTRANKKLSPKNHKAKDSAHKVPITLRSPQRIERDTDVSPRKAPAPLISPVGSPSRSGSTPPTRRSAIEDRSPDSIPVKDHLQRPETGVEDEEAKHAREFGHHKSNKPVERRLSKSIANDDHKKTLEKDESVNYPLGNRRHTEAQSPSNGREGRKNREINDNATNQPKSPAVDKDRRRQEGKDADDAKGSWRNGGESNLKSIEKIDEKESSMNTSGLQESDKRQPEFEGGKRKHGKSKREDSDSGDSFNSETGRKEARRRKKEEKKQRKEERRKRKEDKRRRRDERGGGEKKRKPVPTATTNVKQQPPSSDNEESRDTSGSDFEPKAKRTSYASDGGLSESEQQKKLEIELRNKALESLKAKKKRSVH